MLTAFFWAKCIHAQQNSVVDSLLQKVHAQEITVSLLDKALLIPYDKIVNNLSKSQIIFEALKNKRIVENNPIKLGDLNEKLALVYYLRGNYNGSISLHQQSINLFERAGDRRRQAMAMATYAYESKKRNLKESIRTMWEAISILKEINASTDLATALDNYGVLHEMNGSLDTALFYYNESLKIKMNNKDSVGIPYSLNNIAGICFMKQKLPEGVKYMNQSTAIRNKLNDYIGMAWNEYSLGELFLSNNDNEKAYVYFKKSYNLAQKASYSDLISRNMKYLAKVMANKKEYDSAYYYFNSFFSIYDSLYNASNQKSLLEMESLYENEKKSSQIKQLDNENKLKETELEKKRNSQKFLLFIIALAVVIGLVIYRAYQQKKRANVIILKQKEEVHRQKELVEEQKHLVEEHQKEILDSIRYAKRIQNALLAHQSFIDDNLPNNFVLFKPKDIVSGDFYWAAKHGDNFYLACCDSTGHGVPGAFMSLLNIGFLSEAINEKEITEPNKILDYVRQRLTLSISKEGQKDGFDGILLCVNQQTKQLTYSAAHNAPILISNGVIFELEKDKMPVGVGERKDNFSLHTITMQPNDTLYLYTDGYADQFGGPKGKKFKYKQLNELLLAVSEKPLKDQASLLENAFNDWKGTLEQVDDVCIIGIRV